MLRDPTAGAQNEVSNVYKEPDISLSKLCIHAEKVYNDVFNESKNTSYSHDNSSEEDVIILEESQLNTTIDSNSF